MTTKAESKKWLSNLIPKSAQDSVTLMFATAYHKVFLHGVVRNITSRDRSSATKLPEVFITLLKRSHSMLDKHEFE